MFSCGIASIGTVGGSTSALSHAHSVYRFFIVFMGLEQWHVVPCLLSSRLLELLRSEGLIGLLLLFTRLAILSIGASVLCENWELHLKLVMLMPSPGRTILLVVVMSLMGPYIWLARTSSLNGSGCIVGCQAQANLLSWLGAVIEGRQENGDSTSSLAITHRA